MEKKFGYDPCVMSYWRKPIFETNLFSFSILHPAVISRTTRKRMNGNFGYDPFVTHYYLTLWVHLCAGIQNGKNVRVLYVNAKYKASINSFQPCD